MLVADVLSRERVLVAADRAVVRDKQHALEILSQLLAEGARSPVTGDDILSALLAREQVQSTGVGGGVAVPHASLPALDKQIAALLLCSHPVAFDAIDQKPVRIVLALVGPSGASAQHLRLLARLSRLLRDVSFRNALLACERAGQAHELICAQETNS